MSAGKYPAAVIVVCWVLGLYTVVLLAQLFGQASGRYTFTIPEQFHYIVYGTVFCSICVFLTPIAANLERIIIAYLTKDKK